MRTFTGLMVALLLGACVQAHAGRLMGEVTQVTGDRIAATFSLPVQFNSMMIVLSGEGESVAGMAISDKCTGRGPYEVSGRLSYVADAPELAVGKQVYVNTCTVAVGAARSTLTRLYRQSNTSIASSRGLRPSDNDLMFYYYAAAQTVGYGALGVGYERTVRLSRTLAVALDGGITALGNVSAQRADVVNADQLIKSLSGRVKLDFTRGFGIYTGYRWNEGRGDDQRWEDVLGEIGGKDFVAPSDREVGTVMMQGLEYGVTVRPMDKLAFSVGYIPLYRADYGSLGVRGEPAYTGELRFGGKSGAVRLRGIKSDDYWLADLGITIR